MFQRRELIDSIFKVPKQLFGAVISLELLIVYL